MKIHGNTVLITGASSGIGREIARECAKRGAKKLYLVARRIERLEELARELRSGRPSLEVRVIQKDLVAPGACEELTREIGDDPVEVLVNNAGIGCFGMFDKNDLSLVESTVALNVMVPLRLTHHFLPRMIANQKGGILNISSGFGLSFFPGYATYVGTKHFITGFTETLCTELSGTGVNVTQSCPGPVATEFLGTLRDVVATKPPPGVEISAEYCARKSLDALEKGRALVIPGRIIAAALFFQSLAPRALRRFALSFLGKKLRALP